MLLVSAVWGPGRNRQARTGPEPGSGPDYEAQRPRLGPTSDPDWILDSKKIANVKKMLKNMLTYEKNRNSKIDQGSFCTNSQLDRSHIDEPLQT